MRAKLKLIALVCLPAAVLLAVAVAHRRAPFAFEEPVISRLAEPSAVATWIRLSQNIAGPVIGAVAVVSLVFGLVKGAGIRVVAYAVLAAGVIGLSEDLAKPLVQRTYYGEFTFPSGNVSAVTATVLAMWLALWPVLRRGARIVTLVLGVAWILLVSVAVVGANWHTPLDDIGSLLLSVGLVSAGACLIESVAARGPSAGSGPARSGPRH